MSLAQESESRKSRLEALRRKKLGQEGGRASEEPILTTRNFDPETRTLRKRTREDGDQDDTVEKDIAGLAEKIVAEDEKRRAEDLDLLNIAPKRPNWDLKRELERKMARLERKTQEAIHTLIRQRLAAQNGQTDDIMGAMKAQERAEEDGDSSDDDDE